ncbi:hypothetical protein B7767_21110 [Streptomyces sp. 13-12-16]|uniref:IclR family transcriptional regulator n=1 Tax=Streptomyces sp. 13-12-16 TaxID=1570823 RepID=UPI000A1DE548|nr:IclR family transcriptional regulator C-terminal domain-containing protein [Streptomyces sp. 13-12-16]OSP41402.1 hypothetical protein B7767_21110 [Streptomyces sp. 13-12-16]
MSAATEPSRASGVGVLDKVSIILDLVEQRPAALAELVRRSGLTRPTVHRLAVAMECLDLLTRDRRGWFALGPRLGRLPAEARHDRMARAAGEVLEDLAERTSFSVRLHRLRKGVHVCVASSKDPATGEESVPIGTARPAGVGPIGQVLLAWANAEELYEGLCGARFTARQLALVRRTGWVHGFDDVVPGQAVFAVPVWNENGRVVAALVLAGPQSRLPEVPDRSLRIEVIDAAAELVETSPGRPPAAHCDASRAEVHRRPGRNPGRHHP